MCVCAYDSPHANSFAALCAVKGGEVCLFMSASHWFKNESTKHLVTETKEENMSVKLKPRATMPSSPKSSLGLVTLEPRILLDAAGFVTGADIAMDAMGAQDAQLGVEAIFGNAEGLETLGPTQDDDIASAPLDGPWLDEIALDDCSETGDADPTSAPLDGPWLDEITSDGDDNSTEDDPTSAPLDGPWLDELALGDTDTSGDEDPTGAPLDGPWL